MDISPAAPSASPLDPVNEKFLDTHLLRIRQLIVDEARRIAKDRSVQRPEGMDVAEAARKFAPGVQFPAEPSLWERTKGSLSGVTVVSAVLAVVFGLLGVWVARGHLGEAGSYTAYFDIAKLFAGAIVGSTGAAIVRGPRHE
jgi:hypothetical protein